MLRLAADAALSAGRAGEGAGDPTQPSFRVEPAEAIVTVPLDAVTALYHRRSGATHLVVEPMPAILAALGEGPCTCAVLHQRLAERFDLGAEAEADAALSARLEELVALGLVHRRPGSQSGAGAEKGRA